MNEMNLEHIIGFILGVILNYNVINNNPISVLPVEIMFLLLTNRINRKKIL